MYSTFTLHIFFSLLAANLLVYAATNPLQQPQSHLTFSDNNPLSTFIKGADSYVLDKATLE
ncbi:uncharacterized protein BO88DRAFT_409369 [Aspergillus vadensis CBS 113365]|uniref:Uncharacterized protein n=1 Tax=Aspergillus vadensis (strain CBS 113365 / IMI 142717 / IBT 24658) TaxID=1448311 RepID=A0A319AV77_ASPVC|nr:hypothetical protein BO88DRAFT_409369 [Aspergillus vadensis CBS 113365]PYH63271.1 hypothetical protein BO88DRAFT_409369 [Aspergillus vadensis CBS 113365]